MEERPLKAETPTPLEPAPRSGELGAGAVGGPTAGGAPTRVECRKYSYRHTIKTGARTQYYVINTEKWEILEPAREERSRTGAHGDDVYCLDSEMWRKVVIVKLERSNSGRLYYSAYSENPELRGLARDLEEFLATCRDFEEMELTVKAWVDTHRLIAETFAKAFGRG